MNWIRSNRLAMIFVLWCTTSTAPTVANPIPIVIFNQRSVSEKRIALDVPILRRVFTLADARWFTGERIIVIMKPLESLEHRDFVAHVLGLDMDSYSRIWKVNYRSGRVILAKNDIEMQQYIDANPGSIGYVNYSPIR